MVCKLGRLVVRRLVYFVEKLATIAMSIEAVMGDSSPEDDKRVQDVWDELGDSLFFRVVVEDYLEVPFDEVDINKMSKESLLCLLNRFIHASEKAHNGKD